MHVEIVGKWLSTLPADDDHPYRTGPWRPQSTEWLADDLEVAEGDIPADLDGVYLRNTENPLHPSMKAYHPFDGDGMIHVVGFRDGEAFYRNRFIRTDGLLAENEAGGPLWAGLAEPPALSTRDDGHGARGRMKDASSTDVIVHRGTALTSFYQCGDLYRVDPFSAETLGKESWHGRFPYDWGVSAHPKVDEATGELLFFNYSKAAPYMHYGVVDERGRLVHYVDVPLPGPRLPHDMAFTRNYAILNDFPLFWDPELLKRDVHAARFHSDMPSRFAVIPRRGGQVAARVSLPGLGSHAGAAAPLAAQPAHRGGERGAIVRQHHRIRDDQQPVRRRTLPVRLRRDRQAVVVSVRRPGQTRPAYRRTGAFRVR